MRITASIDGGAAAWRSSLLILPDITVIETWKQVRDEVPPVVP